MKNNRGVLNRSLDAIERIGNRLPDPFMLFVILALFIIVLSYIFSLFDASVVNPGTGKEEPVKNLLSGDGLKYILTSLLDNFTGFAPLGIVLAMMLGIGLVQKVGLLDYAIRKTILNAPPAIITYLVVFIGIMGNLAADAAFIVIPPLTALVFYKIGRHPLAGLAAGYAGAGAGFTANLVVTGTDAVLSGISTEATHIVNESMSVTPVDNWYFNIISVFVLTLVGGLVTSKFIEPRLGEYQGEAVNEEQEEELPNAKKGLIIAAASGLGYIMLLIGTVIAPNSPLRNKDGGLLPSSPFLDGIVPIILFFFIIIGVAFGLTVDKIKSSKDVSHYMAESMKDMANFIVLVFAIAQFTAFFAWSNMGMWIAVNGAEMLKDIHFTGIGLIIGYIILTAILNLFVTSGSAKWAIEAPIFIPLFMQLGYSPAFAQIAYRVGDSSMNIVTPLFAYIIIILGFMKQYDKNASMGSYIALMLPYSISFLITWIIMIVIFYFTGLPYGPGIHTFM